jgi:hypothetical protein
MKGRDTMKGRHNVGVQRTSTGKWPGSQAEPASNKVKTASSYNTTPKPGVLANQAKTSQDLQSRLQGKAPQPFTNSGGAATMSAGTGAQGATPGLEPRIRAGLSGNAAPSNPSGGPAGYSKLPNQSKQIGGRTGVASTPRRAGAQNLSSVKRNASFYGE